MVDRVGKYFSDWYQNVTAQHSRFSRGTDIMQFTGMNPREVSDTVKLNSHILSRTGTLIKMSPSRGVAGLTTSSNETPHEILGRFIDGWSEDDNRILSAEEVAKRTGVTPQTVKILLDKSVDVKGYKLSWRNTTTHWKPDAKRGAKKETRPKTPVFNQISPSINHDPLNLEDRSRVPPSCARLSTDDEQHMVAYNAYRRRVGTILTRCMNKTKNRLEKDYS